MGTNQAVLKAGQVEPSGLPVIMRRKQIMFSRGGDIFHPPFSQLMKAELPACSGNSELLPLITFLWLEYWIFESTVV